MTQPTDDYIQLADFLREKGHSEPNIEKILIKVREYEDKTSMYSVMDSIGEGTLNLGALIDEALKDDAE